MLEIKISLVVLLKITLILYKNLGEINLKSF